jgi:hypothetical protein
MNADRRRLATIILALAMIAGGLALISRGQGQSDRSNLEHQGLIPYSPSRIEWLALRLQAYYGNTQFGDRMHKIVYMRSGPETITIVVQYTIGVNREIMNKDVETARELVDIEAKAQGWTWVQVKEQYLKQE